MSTPMRIRRHPFISPDEKPPKGMNYMPPVPTKVVTTADAAAVLASLTTYNNTYINHDKKHSHKYIADDKSSTKQLKHSIDFNHFNRPVSPRQTAQNQPYIDVAEVFATTVSFIRENNKKLDRLSDEVRSEGQSSDNDMDSDDSMDSYQRSSNNGDNEDIVDEIKESGTELLKKVRLFDIYRGEQIEKNKKSMAYSLNFRDDSRTLKDTEVEIIVNRILENLGKKFNARIRE